MFCNNQVKYECRYFQQIRITLRLNVYQSSHKQVDVIKYAHIMYDGRTQKIPLEDTLCDSGGEGRQLTA